LSNIAFEDKRGGGGEGGGVRGRKGESHTPSPLYYIGICLFFIEVGVYKLYESNLEQWKK